MAEHGALENTWLGEAGLPQEQPSPGTKCLEQSLEAVGKQQPRPRWQSLAEPPPPHGHSSVERTLSINTQLAKLTEVMLASKS